MYYSSDPVLDAGRHYDALYNAADDDDRAMAHETDRLEKETMALAKDGDYQRLRDVLDYGTLDTQVFSALVSCAQAGHKEAQAALQALARKYGEQYAEVA